MSTLREMIFSIREILNAYSDDSTLSNEHLAFLIRNKRSTYLEILANNPRNQMPREAYQMLCMRMKAIPDCEDGKVVLKSDFEIPAVINNMQDTEGIGSVKLDSFLAKWINIVASERIPYIESGVFNDRQLYVSRDSDDRLIMICNANTHVFIDEVKVSVIAEDPETVDKFCCSFSKTASMDFYDKQYPMPESLVKAIVDETSNELLTKYRLTQDSVNNGTDDALNQKIPYYGPRRQQAQQQSGEQQA